MLFKVTIHSKNKYTSRLGMLACTIREGYLFCTCEAGTASNEQSLIANYEAVL